MRSNPISVSSILNCKENPLLKTFDPFLNKVTGLSHIDKLYRSQLAGLGEKELFDKAIQLFGIEPKIIKEQLSNIPKKGPVIVISNHPYGLHDALLLAWVLGYVREDYKVLANSFFSQIQEIEHRIISVDPSRKSYNNTKGVKEALRHLRSGGILGVFPAGAVSHFQLKKWSVTDGEWPGTIARLVKHTEADVVPLHFSGRNSILFQFLGTIHPLIRTVLLPREVLRQKKPIDLKIGKPVKASYLKNMNEEGMIDYLRMRCFLLKETRKRRCRQADPYFYQQIIEPLSSKALLQDIQSLGKENFLFTQGDCDVYIAEADKIPSIVTEIGRLRETTFRKASEGTGKPVDLDLYDEHYLHLFVWNREQMKVVGAYRIGQVDKILDTLGSGGLYTSNFYQYTEGFLNQHRMGLELGRSFVREEYQKKPYSLFLLWKGICSYIARHPKYRYLIGAVSVSKEYESLSRALIASLLQEREESLKSKMPPKIKINREVKKFCKHYQTSNSEDLSILVKSIEKDGKDIPVLLRQYLKLGGRFYSFCEDRAFNNTLDGLIVVDFPNAPSKSLKLFMGEEAEKYSSYHKKGSFRKRDK